MRIDVVELIQANEKLTEENQRLKTLNTTLVKDMNLIAEGNYDHLIIGTRLWWVEVARGAVLKNREALAADSGGEK